MNSCLDVCSAWKGMDYSVLYWNILQNGWTEVLGEAFLCVVISMLISAVWSVSGHHIFARSFWKNLLFSCHDRIVMH